MKTASEIRQGFLHYFEEQGHRVVRSSSLVPESDPTLLFANAGMNQFKDVFLGREKRDYVRAVSCQKCVRAGGKHNDLENVGRTARHHTFFEMLGNFSFGDYFKEDAIRFAWEFLTRELKLPAARLAVTVFRGEEGVPRDAEAARLWTAHVPKDRVLELGAKDNFWAMGDTGPCGPCSEIHFHQDDALPCEEERAAGRCKGVECECDRWLEIWNLVFMQYDRSPEGTLQPLPAPCVDTGMGLERIAAVVQGRLSSYETDLFAPLIDAVAERAGRGYGEDAQDDVSLRVIADHLRATSFLIADGVLPGNEGRSYVLRKIMRRAMRHGKRLGLEGPFLDALSALVVEQMKSAYPQLAHQASTLARVVRLEEERYATTLKLALETLQLSAMRFGNSPQFLADPKALFPGEEAFRLYDTFGLPLDLIEEEVKELGFHVDRAGFERALEEQQERSRQASKLGAISGDPVYLKLLDEGKTAFVGYQTLAVQDARVLAVLRAGKPVKRLDAGESGELLLDRTPFYAESGGQVGDRGLIAANGSGAEVLDCKLPLPGLHVHRVTVSSGGFEPGMSVRAEVDPAFRSGSMRHHTGTHLLHAALREVLGPHVKQAGSLVSPERLRFDFSHYAGVTPPELRHVENRVNGEILRNQKLLTHEMGREQALAFGALAFFGDKYGESVRVVEVPGFSKEFCGGTHVGATGDIGLLLLTEEQGIAAGTRRVEARTGEAALERAREDLGILEELEYAAKTDRRSLVDEYARLREQLKEQQRELQALKLKLATAGGAGAERSDLVEIGRVKLWTPRFEGLDRKAHAAVVDDFRNRNRQSDFVVMSASVDAGAVHVISAVSDSLKERVKAPEVMKRLGLRGGGRPDFAQGGGVEPGDVEALRRKAAELLRELVEASGAR